MTTRTHFLLILALCTPLPIHAAEEWWPQFRGPNAAGVSDSATPPREFGPGTNQLWKAAVPAGSSSPCVWENRVFLSAFEDGKLWTLCLDRENGELLWKRDTQAAQIEEFHPTEGSPAAYTPATDGTRVVSYFGSCGLICHDFDGKELWRHELPTAVTMGSFGSGGSPVIVDGRVLVNRDQAMNSSLLAVDLETGKTAWEAQRPDAPQSFSTPVYWKNRGADEVVMAGGIKLKGYDLKTGEERWSLAGMPAVTCSTPVLGEGMLFVAGWAPNGPDSLPKFDQMAEKADANKDGKITIEEARAAGTDTWFKSLDVNRDGVQTAEDIDLMGAAMAKGRNIALAVKPGGRGELGEDHVVWTRERGLPHVPSPPPYKGRVYLIKDGGMFSCFDATTGEVYFEQERLGTRGAYYASPVAADDRIYVASLEGIVTVLKAGGTSPDILHQADFEERIIGTPALVGDKLYLRTASSLYAFGE